MEGDGGEGVEGGGGEGVEGEGGEGEVGAHGEGERKGKGEWHTCCDVPSDQLALQEIIIVMLEDEAGSQPPKRRRRVAKKVPAWLAMEPCCCCLDRGYECEKPLAGMKGTACPRCVKLHITCKRARVEGDKEEEVLEWRKCMWPEVIILIAGPLQAAAPPLEDAIWALLKKVAGHLRMIVSKVKRIGDEVHKVKEDRRVRKTLQVGVQTEVHEVMEVGVGEEEEGKGEEVEDGEARDKDGEGDEDMEE